jgi:hypothetical protein
MKTRLLFLFTILMLAFTSNAQIKFPKNGDTIITIEGNTNKFSLKKILLNSTLSDISQRNESIDKIGYLKLDDANAEKMPIRKNDSSYISKMPIKKVDFANTTQLNNKEKIVKP